MITFKTPKFWYKNSVASQVISTLLLPFSMIFIMGGIIRGLSKNHTIKGKFVICVGNATLGGNGKTPTVLALYEELSQIFPNDICILTKGHGRKTKGFLKVEKNMDANIIGDEPAILIQHAPVYLFTRITDVLKNISAIKEQIIITDDGMQNQSFHKNFTLFVVGDNMFGNSKIFPAGPLRESIKSADRKSDAILFTGKDSDKITDLQEILHSKKPFHHATQTFKTTIPPQEIMAFSGLGDNSKFKKSLEDTGFIVKKFFDFADHHRYKPHEITHIINNANGLSIVTTQKDFVKLQPQHQKQVHVLYLKYQLEIDLIKNLEKKIKKLYKGKIL